MAACRLRVVTLLGALLVASVVAATSFGSPARTGPWHVFSTHSSNGRTVATVGGRTLTPEALELKVRATPNVSTQINYSIDCEKSGTHPELQTLAPRRTPFTLSIPVPLFAPWCFVNITASKSTSARMTLTLLARTS
jgi:hypothetical protein